MTFGGIAVGVGLTVGAGASIYGAVEQSSIAGQQLSLENSQNNRQQIAFNQLQSLINDPASFFSSPVYNAAFNQGSQAVSRQAAAQGVSTPIGGQATALQAFGQSFGQQQLLGQEQLLAGMTGTGFNPASAGSVASGASQAAAGSLSNLAGLLSFFGTSGLTGGGMVPSGDFSAAQWSPTDLNSFSSGMGSPVFTAAG